MNIWGYVSINDVSEYKKYFLALKIFRYAIYPENL